MKQAKPTDHKANKRTAVIAAVVFAAMVGATFAAAPLYSMFCKATGYGGTTQRAEAAPKTVLAQKVQVRFDTNVAPGSPITFAPEERTKTVRLGETGLVFFKVTNPSDKTVTAVATYNVTPEQTGKYFKKLECFCFEKRAFAPGEAIDLPVVFFVDPELAKDKDVGNTDQITLSYTYFDGGAPDVKTVSAEAPKGLGRVVGRVVAIP
jgi:cytochrome c oxidase assembly protein subunit 11